MDGYEQRQSAAMQRSSGSFMNDEQSEKRIEISQEIRLGLKQNSFHLLGGRKDCRLFL